jgi:hypothetical protein
MKDALPKQELQKVEKPIASSGSISDIVLKHELRVIRRVVRCLSAGGQTNVWRFRTAV